MLSSIHDIDDNINSFIHNEFFLIISSFINNDITYNINGFTTRYIVIDRLMHNDFSCYLLFLKTPFIFFFRIVVKKKMYGAKSRPLRFFIVLLHTPRPANSSASIAAHKTDRRRNGGGFLSCCYIPPGPLLYKRLNCIRSRLLSNPQRMR